MSTPARTRVAILAYPGASACSVYAPYDEFRGVERLWAYYNGEPCPHPPFHPEVVTIDNEPVAASGGARISPTATAAWAERAQIIFLPSLMCDERLDPAASSGSGRRFPMAVTDWIRKRFDEGSLLCAMCSGVFLLAESGLLDGRRATTHWAFADVLAAEFPAVTVDASAPLVIAGPQERIVTGGAATYAPNLTLYLVSRFSSPEAAHRYARATGLFCQSGSQKLVARHLQTTRVADARIASALRWLSEHLAADAPVNGAAEAVGLSARTFARRFQQATGTTPIKYLQRLRVEEARRLLEAGELPVAEIGAAVGYADITAFRRLFRREVGVTPADYRRSFRLPPRTVGGNGSGSVATMGPTTGPTTTGPAPSRRIGAGLADR